MSSGVHKKVVVDLAERRKRVQGELCPRTVAIEVAGQSVELDRDMVAALFQTLADFLTRTAER